MSALELTEEERMLVIELTHSLASRICITPRHYLTIIHKLQAAKNKAEFWKDHNEDPGCDGTRDCDICYWVIPFPGNDPRHDYTDEQWIEDAKKELSTG